MEDTKGAEGGRREEVEEERGTPQMKADKETERERESGRGREGSWGEDGGGKGINQGCGECRTKRGGR